MIMTTTKMMMMTMRSLLVPISLALMLSWTAEVAAEAGRPTITSAFLLHQQHVSTTSNHHQHSTHGDRRTAATKATAALTALSMSSSTQTPADSNTADRQQRQQRRTATSPSASSWQADVEELLGPTTSLARRQILTSELLSNDKNAQIRDSVQAALRDRKIDPLLTPTGRKIQQGTRAVARQLTNDILPTLARTATAADISRTTASSNLLPRPEQVNKVGTRVLNAIRNQVQKNVETLREDLANPTKIPERLTRDAQAIIQEVENVFAETPVGLKEPSYRVIYRPPYGGGSSSSSRDVDAGVSSDSADSSDDYEIREYDEYVVASTNMASADDVLDSAASSSSYLVDDLAKSGAAFNSLAAYLFGANKESKVMEMTTPVTTTMNGEMRFYLDRQDQQQETGVPEPLEQDGGKSIYETNNIDIQTIPKAVLAVRKFTGFVTAGEVARQKETLLACLQLDGIEIDVPHGQPVSHVIFQYNPPYTIPVLRRNEIAIPVIDPTLYRDGDGNGDETGAPPLSSSSSVAAATTASSTIPTTTATSEASVSNPSDENNGTGLGGMTNGAMDTGNQ